MNLTDFKKLRATERSDIVQMESCSLKILSWAALKDSNCSVRCWAVENHNCPPKALIAVLKKESFAYIRFWAVHNPACPAEAHIIALTDTAENVRQAAAEKI